MIAPAARRGRPAVEPSPSGTIRLAHNGLTARAGSVLRPSPRAYRGLLASALRAFRGSQRRNVPVIVLAWR